MAAQDDIARKQQRIDFLKKTRPNDPEIKKRQQEIKALKTNVTTSPIETGDPAKGANPSQPKDMTPAASVSPNPPVSNPWPDQPLPDTVNFNDPNSVLSGQQKYSDITQAKNSVVNNPNQQGPLGSRQYGTDQNGRTIINDTMDPNQQNIYQNETGTDAFAAGLAGSYLQGAPKSPYNANDVNGSNPVPTANSADRTKVEGAVYSNLTQDLDKNFDKSVEAKKQELANRGVPFNSVQYNDQMDQLAAQHQRAQTEAHSQAIAQGGQEMATQFGLGLQGHQQALSDYTSNYTTPASLAGSLEGIGQGYQLPQFQQYNPSQYSAPDLGGIYGNAMQGAFQNAQLAQSGSQFQQTYNQNKVQFNKQLAEQAREANLAAAKKGGGGGGGSAPSMDPSVGGVAGLVAQ